MNISIQHAIETRTSINNFQPNRSLDEDTIKLLVELATKAPSAYNLQNWRFIAVRSEESKQLLKAAAFGQDKITDASVNFIICGTFDAHHQLHNVLQPSLENNIMGPKVIDSWVRQATNAYKDNAILQRDEAVRSASLAAMTLILAAQEMGLGTCAMGGFDTKQISQDFELTANELPVMIVAVGYPTINNWPQKIRKPVANVLTIV
ncbi:nitroreductase family protein [Acinetobacter calcoaceticus]|uniref:nitroreductase family protein n=1 Tax=Acinetobacter calcoaceticus TaxID=471 RepID=UPI0005DD0BC0|nr:nitroreductase family protein [Acinetobacter calcoaceticus]KJH62092.1 NAD(P)H nitroreductase [Acinetobacter calcoaceticus]